MYQSVNLYTEQVVESFPEHTDEEIGRILASADRTYREDWRSRSFESRAAVLKKAATLLREQRADYARTVTLEVGKLLNEALGEVEDLRRSWNTMLTTRPKYSLQRKS